MKILNKPLYLLNLRPNCLLTRKPVLVISSTTVYGWTWLKKRLFHWQIRRHGYPTQWPTPSAIEIKKHPEKFKFFHILDVNQVSFSDCIDHLIICAEKDFLETS